jgi:hypothetical protein
MLAEDERAQNGRTPQRSLVDLKAVDVEAAVSLM